MLSGQLFNCCKSMAFLFMAQLQANMLFLILKRVSQMMCRKEQFREQSPRFHKEKSKSSVILCLQIANNIYLVILYFHHFGSLLSTVCFGLSIDRNLNALNNLRLIKKFRGHGRRILKAGEKKLKKPLNVLYSTIQCLIF